MSTIILSVSCSKETSQENGDSLISDIIPGTEGNEASKEVGDGSSRSAAKKLYDDFYVAATAQSSDVSWTGDIPSCDAGDVPQATKDKILRRLSYFRLAAGLNNVISENTSKSEKAQKAALMMHANGTLDHSPPDDWKCFSADGKEGAGNSLLTSTKNAASIDSYIQDRGSDNFPVGHRRWLLWPRLQEIGVGNTSSYNALWVLGNPGTPSANNPEFIAWPPKGYLPKQLAYPRWSFSIAKADFEQTEISMKTQDGNNVPLEIEELTGIYGDNTIVWRPEINANALLDDTTYIISLTKVGIDDALKDFEYEVVLFDVDK